MTNTFIFKNKHLFKSSLIFQSVPFLLEPPQTSLAKLRFLYVGFYCIYTGTEDLQNAAMFWHKRLYLVGERCFFTVHTRVLSISSVFKKLHNTMIEWLNDTNVELCRMT